MKEKKIQKKVEILGTRVKLIIYIENLNLCCEVYVDNNFIEKFQVNIIELFKNLKG